MSDKEQLIQKLFANECSKQELNLLFELIQMDNSETAPEIMMTLLEQMEENPALESATSKRILNRVMTTITEHESIQKQSKKQVFWLQRVAAAAAVFLFLSVAWLAFQHFNTSELMARTGFDERKELTLPDGSQVTLNANSTITYFSDWSEGETRIVNLQGEAYFKVENKQATDTKFQVLTNDLTVEVLGTVFNVNTRQEATKVYLEEGKIRLNLEDKKSSQLFLEPGEVVTYSAKRKLLVSPQKVESESEVSWKNGFLIFKDAPLKEILEKLTATNNFEFEIETADLGKREWTLALPIDDITVAMSLLSKITGASIHKEDNKYIFRETTNNIKK